MRARSRGILLLTLSALILYVYPNLNLSHEIDENARGRKVRFSNLVTGGECARDYFAQAGYTVTNGTDWDTLWTMRGTTGWPEVINAQYRHNRCLSDFSIASHKGNLWRAYRAGREAHGLLAYNFLPETFVLSSDMDAAIKTLRLRPRIMIAKPERGLGGRGIRFITNVNDLRSLPLSSRYVLQDYITSPMIIGARKFSIRRYVVVRSLQPLRIRIHDQMGVVLFTMAPYNVGNLTSMNGHLTNTHQVTDRATVDRVMRDDEQDMNAHKWSLHALKMHLDEHLHNLAGVAKDDAATEDDAERSKWNVENRRRIFREMDDIVVKMIFAAQAERPFPTRTPGTCMNLYAVDFMLDTTPTVKLLEFNSAPEMCRDHLPWSRIALFEALTMFEYRTPNYNNRDFQER